MTTGVPLLESIVVDTNALHHVRMYLHQLDQENRDHNPLAGLGLTEIFVNGLDKNMQKSVKAGHRCLSYLLGSTGARIVYGPMVVLEQAGGMVKAQLVRKFAYAGAPLRNWSHMNERQVLENFEAADYHTVSQQLDEARQARERYGLLSQEPTPEEHQVLWQIAPRILGQVPLADKDAVVYATALAVQASTIITNDDHLFKVSNWLRDPTTAGTDQAVFDSAKLDLTQTLANLTGNDIDDLIVPEPKKF